MKLRCNGRGARTLFAFLVLVALSGCACGDRLKYTDLRRLEDQHYNPDTDRTHRVLHYPEPGADCYVLVRASDRLESVEGFACVKGGLR